MPDDEETPAPAGSAERTALAAAGEAAAFFTGAPIAGAADAAVGLGDVAADRERRLEDAIAGTPQPGAARKGISWTWIVFGLVVIAALIWALIGRGS